VNDAAARCGIRAFHDLSNKFIGFTPGYNVVVSGPYATRGEAERILKGAKQCVPDAYLKYAKYTGNYSSHASSSERDERERPAENTRRRLQKQAAEDQLDRKLEELGFERVSPEELSLDWKSLMTSQTRVAVRGTYAEAHDIEWLKTPYNRDLPEIRLFTDQASREARKLMLECRNSDFRYSSCEMIVGATIKHCVRNKGELNEKAVPCLDVREAYLDR
jgi:hypothetical protein